jgi:hypothetical protein
MIPPIAHLYTNNLKSPYPHYSLYYQPLETLIASIIGLFVVVTMFYLGKFHDSHIEQIRYSSELIEVFDRLKIRFKIIIDPSKKAEIEKIEKTVDEYNKSIREEDKWYFNLSKTALIPFMLYTVLFGSYYFDTIKYSQNPILGNFVYLLILVGFGIALFLISWFLHEKTLSSIKLRFQTMSDWTLKIKSILYELELKDKLPISTETPKLNTDNKI